MLANVVEAANSVWIAPHRRADFSCLFTAWLDTYTVMKFYYCETCGKRVTDEDLASGMARDKQVKGVFCRDCKEGVSTIAFTPIKQSELREVQEAPTEPPRKPRATFSPATGARSRSGVTGATRKEQSEREPARGLPPGLRIGLVAGGAIMVVAVILLCLQNKHEPKVPVASGESSKPPISSPQEEKLRARAEPTKIPEVTEGKVHETKSPESGEAKNQDTKVIPEQSRPIISVSAWADKAKRDGTKNTRFVLYTVDRRTYPVPVTLHYAVKGSAVPDVDCVKLSGTVVLAPNMEYCCVMVDAVKSSKEEPEKTVELTVVSDAAYKIGPVPTATCVIEAQTR